MGAGHCVPHRYVLDSRQLLLAAVVAAAHHSLGKFNEQGRRRDCPQARLDFLHTGQPVAYIGQCGTRDFCQQGNVFVTDPVGVSKVNSHENMYSG